MGYTLDTPPTGASDMAGDLGLSQMAKEGLGYGWQQNFVRSALAKNFDYGGMMESGGNSLANQGLLYSGAMDAQLPAEVANVGQGIAGEAYNSAVAKSDQVATEAQRTQLQIKTHEDRMQLEYDIASATLEQNERNWWDEVIAGAGVAANLTSTGIGVRSFFS